MSSVSAPVATSASSIAPVGASYLVLRHRWPVRVMHWINVLCFSVLLMSGLMIFNAHPSLDWGDQSYSGKNSVLQIGSRRLDDGRMVGVTRVLDHTFRTTGVLGLSKGSDGELHDIAFPSWMTIPSYYSLADARRWHFFFAWLFVINGVCFIAYALISRHLQRDLLPTRSDWRGIGRSVRDHLLLRHAKGEDAKRFNILQKLAYLVVIFVLLPLIVLAGWAMSPGLDSLWPGWVAVFGGRQSARTIHFIVAWLLVAFVFIHVFELLVAGVWNQTRSMITGRLRIHPSISRPHDE